MKMKQFCIHENAFRNIVSKKIAIYLDHVLEWASVLVGALLLWAPRYIRGSWLYMAGDLFHMLSNIYFGKNPHTCVGFCISPLNTWVIKHVWDKGNGNMQLK